MTSDTEALRSVAIAGAPVSFSTPRISALNANVAAKGLSLNQKQLGGLALTAATEGGAVTFNLTSDLAQADIRGNGRMQLGGDNPLDARVTFSRRTRRVATTRRTSSKT